MLNKVLLSSAIVGLSASLLSVGAASNPPQKASDPPKVDAGPKADATPKPDAKADPKAPADPKADAKPVDPKAPAVDANVFGSQVHPFLSSHCASCHGGKSPASGLALDGFKDEAAAMKDPDMWGKVLKKLQSKTMPPPGLPKPTEAEYQKMIGWIVSKRPVENCSDAVNPGRVTMRRLNRVEYKNTVRDLMGVDFKDVQDFPADDVGYGFDNIGDVLSLPPLLMERYLGAAEKLVEEGAKNVLVGRPTKPIYQKEWERKTLQKFATHAFRRPVTGIELNRLLKLAEKVQSQEKTDGDPEAGLKMALEAVLVSPMFLYHVENPAPVDGGPKNLGDYELASRLSYFLWSSMPDDTLLAAAKDGTLRNRDGLEAQVERMLKDQKVHGGLVENFGGQWLQLRRLNSLAPDPDLFPAFTPELRADMKTETELFFQSIMQEDRSVLDLIDGKYTFLNERLAKLYNIPGVKGENFRRVALNTPYRGGILTQASFLTLTSNPTRTSPVKRGKWVLEQFLNDAPPPPPANVGELPQSNAKVATASVRERLEQHRKDPKCASCHSRMDPIGFAFENYNAIGKFRLADGKFPVDSSGSMPDGKKFRGPEEMKTILKARKNDFSRCLTEKMLTFALGRGMESYDRCAVDAITGAAIKNHYKFSTFVMGIVESDPFQKRGAEPPPPVDKGKKA